MAQLLSNLPVGAGVKFGKHSVNGETAQDIKWLIANKSGDIVTLITTSIIDFRAFDARETGNYYGNARYQYSNIRQWLNSSSLEWYVAQHSGDVAPSDSSVANETFYAQRPGFLYHFSTSERNALQSASIITKIPSSSTETYTTDDKVFLPSYTEVMSGTGEGNKLSLFNTTSYRQCGISSQAERYSLVSASDRKASWWLRTAVNEGTVRVITSEGEASNTSASYGYAGVRPCISLGTLKVSDTTDSDGCYTFILNSAPNTPATITTPTTIYGGKSNTISWSSVTDPDGDSVTYQLECSLGGGDYTQIYSGASTSYTHLVPFGITSVVYRVKATDTSNASSTYTNSATITVVNNNAPVITNADDTIGDKNLGTKYEGFTGTYKVTDADNNEVTVTESIDGVQIRSLVATLGQDITYGVTGNTWLALSNGSHTLTIRATDGIDSTIRTYTFTKLVDSFTIQNSTPWVSENMPTRIMMVMTRNIPDDAIFKVEVCNNGYDTSPTWEDATNAVVSGLVHVFTNTSKTATNWGVKFRVTVERNESTGACYISTIGGNFE